MTLRLFAFLVMVTVLPTTVDAQSTAPSAVPQEVRVISWNGARRTGVLVSLTAEELTLRQDGREWRLPLADVRRVERVTHHMRTRALVGAAVGFATGWLVCQNCGAKGEHVIAMWFGLIGAGAGGGIGAYFGHELDRKSATALYVAPSKAPPGVHVQPSFGRRSARLDLTLGW